MIFEIMTLRKITLGTKENILGDPDIQGKHIFSKFDDCLQTNGWSQSLRLYINRIKKQV